MKKRSQMNKQRRMTVLRRAIISSVALIIGVAAVLALTLSWLDRTKDNIEGVGFSYSNSGKIMRATYTVETFYLDQDNSWNSITVDYFRADGKDGTGINWEETWDENSGVLVPGTKTEFKTVITSLVPYDQKLSLYLKDVYCSNQLQDKISIGAITPQELLTRLTEEEYFTKGDEETTGSFVPLCLSETLPAEKTVTVNWYVNTSADIDGGAFEALADGTTHQYIRDNDSTYYFVNTKDENGVPNEAILCDKHGQLVYNEDSESENKYTLYTGNYTATESKTVTFGMAGEKTKISGMYLAVG